MGSVLMLGVLSVALRCAGDCNGVIRDNLLYESADQETWNVILN